MLDGADPVRTQLRSELLSGVLPWVVDKAFEMPEIEEGIERAGIDGSALWRRVTSDERLMLTSGPEFAAVYKFARKNNGGIDQSALDAELRQPDWPIRWGIFYDTSRSRRAAGSMSLHEALSEWCTIMLRDTVLPELRRAINTELHEGFSTTLTIGAIPGLERRHDPAFTVDTASTTRFRAAVARIHGSGALGLAGPRGAGKTALIDQYVAGLYGTDGETEQVGMTVACPVHYEARDFVLHLHATLCRVVLERIDAMNAGERRRDTTDSTTIDLASLLGGILLVLATLAGVAYLAIRPDFAQPILPQLLRPSRPPAVWMVPLFLIAGSAVLVLGSMVLRLLRRLWSPLADLLRSGLVSAEFRRLPRRARNGRHSLRQFVLEQLRHIKLLQTSTTGWSGTATLPWALTVGRSKSIQLAERAQTFPETVDALRDLIARCGATLGLVVIAIDELDKITSAERAQVFVNEIKGIFGVPGCLYIVSLSDDALVSFERSTLGVRDAFDSAFDEVVRLDYLSLGDSLALLHSRVIGIPEPFGWLCHCLSGGLPRELLRLVRRIAEYRHSDSPPTLADVCEALVGEDLAKRNREFRIMASRTRGDSPRYPARNASAKDLLATARQFVRRPTGTPDPETERRRSEAAMFAYHGATLKEVFVDHLDHEQASAACTDGELPGTFDQLSRARGAVLDDPRLAWLLIDEFRAAWHLEIVDGREN